MQVNELWQVIELNILEMEVVNLIILRPFVASFFTIMICLGMLVYSRNWQIGREITTDDTIIDDLD